MPSNPKPVPIHPPLGPLTLALIVFAVCLAVLGVFATGGRADPPAAGAGTSAAPVEGVHAFEARRIDGAVESLERYRGQVLLIVNTASRCGYTPQYEGLQKLYEDRRGRGLTVLGFPSNDFGNQEPGTDRKIGEFCKANYGVDFPMFSKVHVNGADAHPLYVYLTSRPEPVGGPVGWNFQKYLVDRDGRVVARFESRVRPDDRKLVSAIDALLGGPVPTADRGERVMLASAASSPWLARD